MRIFTIISLVLLTSTAALAQEADRYFHNGAQSFINAKVQEAIQQVQEGLAQYPDDPKLNALLQKLNEEKEKQQQQNQQNQDQQQQQDQEQQQQQEQQNQDQQNQEQEQKEQEKQEQENQNQSGEKEDAEQKEGQELKPQQMSKEEAEKILQALAQKEKELLKEFKKQKSEGSAKHEKDW